MVGGVSKVDTPSDFNTILTQYPAAPSHHFPDVRKMVTKTAARFSQVVQRINNHIYYAKPIDLP